ncbi:Cyclin-B1-1 [Apostasia shenzhenica]|uniref:Cyclin-B1-1 n=1 Tax=Apostasia shenzhenica TaxID=1088818 RepID=A0A2I0AJH1_9ASPA|nr:Cyclin-B1-1 [Apostasia shenzhenica]
MASRTQAPIHQQQRGAAVPVPAQKQKGAAIADSKNRKALEDIGNFANLRITDGKQINRPITRSFGAQLLANARGEAAADTTKNGQKQVVQPALRAARKKPPIRNQKAEFQKPESKTSRASSTKKKANSLSSVLTARSKIACGIKDIDVGDGENELAMSEYVEDLYKFYKQNENSCQPIDYIGSQIEINAKMRAILVDWLVEVHQKFELMPETLYLTVNIIDRYLSLELVHRKELQLVGVGAMLIACKYEEIWAPEVQDFILISDGAYTRVQVLRMEKKILNKLEWSLTYPTPYVFIVRFLKAAISDKEMESMTFFFAELALMHYSMVRFCPSMLAASAVYAACCTLKKKSTPWSKTLEYHTSFSEEQLMECAKLMLSFHSSAQESKLSVIYRKYSKEEHGSVALKASADFKEGTAVN